MVFMSQAQARGVTEHLNPPTAEWTIASPNGESPKRSFVSTLLPEFLSTGSLIAQRNLSDLIPYRGSVSVIYNLRESVMDLELSAETLADIFEGDVTNWQQVHVRLPQEEIRVVTLRGSSLTNLVFTRYLNQVTEGEIEATWDPTWTNRLIYSKPEKDGELAAIVDRTPGAIGYVSSVLAEYYEIPTVRIKDRDGTEIDRIN